MLMQWRGCTWERKCRDFLASVVCVSGTLQLSIAIIFQNVNLILMFAVVAASENYKTEDLPGYNNCSLDLGRNRLEMKCHVARA